MKPEALAYAKTHEWVANEDVNGQRVATVGISAFAVQQLTDLVYIELPKVGRQVKAGDSFGEIESVKAVSDLYSPVTGEVVAVNSELADHLEWFSDDPYGKGWIAKVRVDSAAPTSELLDFAAYQKQCAEAG
ncbi:MAG: glycine cleavage system protein GcvH [Pirellulales bacterium]